MRLSPDSTHNRIPVLEWLKSARQTETSIKRFWETILVSALGDQLPRLTLGAARKVLIDGFASNPTAYHLLVPKAPLDSVIGNACFEKLSREGVEIRLGTNVQGLVFRDSDCEGVVAQSGETISCDAVFLAVPWHRAARWLSSSPLVEETENRHWIEGLGKIESAPITGIHTWWDRAWLETPHAILLERLCQWVFPGSKPAAYSHDGATGHYQQVVISGSRDLPKGNTEAILKEVEADLQGVFPAAKGAKLLRGKVVTDPNAVFSIPSNRNVSRPLTNQFSRHRIWICGDWVETGWPATMEGAIRSGVLSAQSFNATDDSNYGLASDLTKSWLASILIR